MIVYDLSESCDVPIIIVSVQWFLRVCNQSVSGFWILYIHDMDRCTLLVRVLRVMDEQTITGKLLKN